MTTWLKTRPGLTLGGLLGCLGGSIQKCAVHFSDRLGPAVTIKPPFSEPDPDAVPYLDSPCSGISFGFDSGPGCSFTAHVLLDFRPAAPAPDVPID